MKLTVGQRIDGYRVDGPLGVGGMSEAYLARGDEGGAQVVIKLPHQHLIGDPTTYSRFEREVEIGRRLVHPNIQRVLGAGRLPGGIAPYLVTEYVDGETFREYLANHKPLAIDQTVDFAHQIGDALAYCHQQGVVHRDLKPENILVSSSKTLKLMDFGIALLQGARRVTWGSLSNVVGTPDYMAPEQVRGERGDERTDVYSLGVIIFEMLAGTVPFQGDNALAIMSQRVNNDAPPVNLSRPDAPRWLAAVVARALARDPAQRYPSMTALVHDLDHPDQVDLTVPAGEAGGEFRLNNLPAAWVTWLVVGSVVLILVLLGVVAQMAHHAQAVH